MRIAYFLILWTLACLLRDSDQAVLRGESSGRGEGGAVLPSSGGGGHHHIPNMAPPPAITSQLLAMRAAGHTAPSPAMSSETSASDASVGEGPPKPQYPRLPLPLLKHDAFMTQFNRNLNYINGLKGKLAARRVEAWTGTLNHAFIKPKFVNSTMRAIIQGKHPAADYVSDSNVPNDAEELLHNYRKQMKAYTLYHWRKNLGTQTSTNPSPPWPLVGDHKWHGPGPDPTAIPIAMVGGPFGPMSSLPVQNANTRVVGNTEASTTASNSDIDGAANADRK